jgi:hypothetical protein
MAIDATRRGLLMAGAGVAAGAAGWSFLAAKEETSGHLLLSACDDANGRHAIAGWNVDGELCFRIPVAQRAHAAAIVPGGSGGDRAIFFARRPGTVSSVVDLAAGRIEREIVSAAGRHFYGHGVVSPDGRYLYATENDFDNARGVLGIYDLDAGCARVGEYDTGGTGPHELAFLGDGRTLAVLNGGIETHPERPRKKLNIDTMQPSLAYIDTRDGRLLERYRPDDHKMSLRHLSVTPDDRVVIGVQYEGDPAALVPLLLTHRGETQLVAAQADAPAWMRHRNYIASVATSGDGATALITAPRGDTVSLWHLATHTLLTQLHARDIAGAVFLRNTGDFYVTDGLGQVFAVTSDGEWRLDRRYADGSLRWDNHATPASPHPSPIRE